MDFKKPSAKAIKYFNYPDKRINILEGSIRSSKTTISLLKYAWRVKNEQESFGMMTGRTRDTIIRNCIIPLQEMLGDDVIKLNIGRGYCTIYGKLNWILGFNDIRSEFKLRGASLQFAYVDEITLAPKEFTMQLLGRLSHENSALVATCNPDSPYHYIKTDFIDRANDINLNLWHFVLDDNPALPSSYVEALKKEYTGLWFQRYILGLWVLAEGVVYQMFDESRHVRPPEEFNRLTRWAVSVDYGTRNSCVFGLYGIDITTNAAYMVKEFYYDSVKTGRQKTDSEYAADLLNFISGYPVEAVIVDPSALSFITELKQWRRRGIPRVLPAINDVIPGIQTVSKLLNTHRLYIHPRCKNTIREFGAYVWDDKAVLRGEDKPMKVSDHSMDQLRYYCQTWYVKGKFKPTKEDAKGYGGIK